MTTGTCRRPNCDARILWLKNDKTGKLAPIDAEPSWGGNIALIADPTTGEAVGYRIIPKAERGRTPWHRNHWMTCADPPPRPDKRVAVIPKRRSNP